MGRIRLGHIPVWDDRWFIFMEEDRLFLHRIGTGSCIYEADFAPTEGGYVIERAVITDDRSVCNRGSDQFES